MYKWAVRMMIRRNIARLNAGDLRPTLATYRRDAVLAFPGRNSWASMFRTPVLGRERFDTHRGRDEIEAFLGRYVDVGLQMAVEDILVNGPPWNTRIAVRVRDWAPGEDSGADRYCNRAVLWVTSSWGRIRVHEDYEDTQRAAAFDELLESDGPTGASVDRSPTA